MNASANKVVQKLQMRSSGFTLIELMVTIAVLAIIVGMAAPSINSQLANQRIKSTTATLVNALKEAKNESLIRRQEVEASYNNTSNTIKLKVNASGSTKDEINSYQYDAKSTINSIKNKVEFKPNKTADVVTFTICDTNNTAAPRQILVSKLGQISVLVGGNCS